MLDLKFFRENPERVRDGVARKKFECDLRALYALDDERRVVVSEAEQARARQKAANKEMAALPKGSDAFKAKVQEMKAVSTEVKDLEAKAKAIDDRWRELFMQVPNLPHDSVPDGRSEEENKVIATWGDPEQARPYSIAHFDIPWFSQAVDLEHGALATGAGFPFYVGPMARLQRALINFFLDEAAQAGFVELQPPLLVNADSATATGQLPDKEGQMYHAAADDLYLIPTSEVPVTNFFRDHSFEEKQLPVYRTAYSPCFRREAGSWGAHVRGLNRLHQFDKVEVVKWTHPDNSFNELELLREHVEGLLQKLELPYRVLLMCAGDIGFPHAKQYDLEVFAAGQQRWLEVSSCSNFTDFQARRAGIRFKPAGGGKAEYVHTLNGSALALPRTVGSLLENHLQADHSVKLPAVLHPYFGGDTLRWEG
ncbi:MAG: serine--tRNA ligase [Opitutales bacterium]